MHDETRSYHIGSGLSRIINGGRVLTLHSIHNLGAMGYRAEYGGRWVA